jgi:DNA-binding NtrC family response regulator
MRERLLAGARPGTDELGLYEDVVQYALYTRHEEALYELVVGDWTRAAACWRAVSADVRHYLALPGLTLESGRDVPHLFAYAFQVRRAFHHIFRSVIGVARPAARLRATIWESIFTHDMRRYRRGLYRALDDVTTLVTGPSGTGKEIVARAIALSRYVPFDAKSERFAADGTDAFHPLNLSALSPTLIESELFGHRRGAFTGALEDRVGWFEACTSHGTVFLDEIGDLDPAIQVKLLRVLQTRVFQRLGDTKDRRFRGRLVAATNRDLAAAIHDGRFRGDLFYRLCGDLVTTPSLRAQLDDCPSDLALLTHFLVERIVGPAEADALAADVVAWIDAELGGSYPWPGNVRELEQCVRNVIIRRSYRPTAPGAPRSARDALATAVRDGSLTADELLNRYCSLVFAESGSYLETARRLALDRRTVRRRVDPALVATFRRS